MNELLNVNNEIIETNERLIERYLKFIDVSESTNKEYLVGLKNFFNYINNKNINNITREDIINYREHLKLDNKSANTINLYLVSVKNFFKWLDYENIYKDISKNIKSLPIESTHKRDILNIEQVRELLNYCQDLKERLIIALAITTGLRCNEICNIRVQDFIEKNGTICLYVLGKARQGMRTDFVVISQETFDLVKEYINKYNIQEYLFISKSNNSKGQVLSTRSMRNIVNKIYERAGIKSENLVFHSLRHSFSTIAIQSGVDIREVSQSLRHKEISTTMRYLHDLEAINNNCSKNVSNLLFA